MTPSLVGVYGNIRGYPNFEDYKTSMERFILISAWANKIIQSETVSHIFLEGYSMGSRGKVFDIAENTAILKVGIHVMNIPLTSIPPTVIKKFACQKGNADKEKMYEAFLSETNTDLHNLLTPKRKNITNPVSDIIDAYYICKYGLENIILAEKSLL